MAAPPTPTERYGLNVPRHCENCGAIIPADRVRSQHCSDTCKAASKTNKTKAAKAGK